MYNLFIKSRNIIKKEGLFVFVKKLLVFIFKKTRTIVSLPSYLYKIKYFKKKEHGELFDFVYRGCNGFFSPMQTRDEFLDLLKIVRYKNPVILLEIGTAHGGTLFCFSKILGSNAVLISLDLPGGKYGGGYGSMRRFFYGKFITGNQQLSLLQEDSHSEASLQKVKTILGDRKIDFLFIDGDHSYEGVKKDFEMYGPLVAKGGVVAFHDVAPQPREFECFVSDFWNEISKDFKNEFIVHGNNPDSHIPYGIGVLYM